MRFNTALTLWLSSELREKLEDVAYARRTTLSALAREVFEAYVKKQHPLLSGPKGEKAHAAE